MKDFKLTASTLNDLAAEVGRLITTGKAYRVSIVEWRDKRSINQNSLFHMWCAELSVYLIKSGRVTNDEKFCKRLLKSTFLGYEWVTTPNAVTGEMKTTEELRHTSKLEPGDMHHFMNECYHWCHGIGLILTIPQHCQYKDLMDQQCE